MKELRIIIAGSRDFNDHNKLNVSMREILGDRNFDVDKIVIVSGTARGADKMGEQFAENKELGIKRFPADWDGLGKRAGYVRNADMAKYSVSDGNIGMLVAFWDGKSKGTKHMIDLAKRYGLEVHVVNF